MIVVLLGPPGVGKGTQGTLLADALGWERIVTGDLLRAARREGTELGRQAQKYMDAGELVPDDLVVALVRERLERLEPSGRGVVFDGFPRTVAQAEALDRTLDRLGLGIDRVLLLEAPDDVLVKRLAGRRSCSACGAVHNVHFEPPRQEGVCDRCGGELTQRADDRPETVRHRLEVYRRDTEPLVRYYEAAGAHVRRVPADQEIEDVQAAVRAGVGGAVAGEDA